MNAEWPLVKTGDTGAPVKALQRLLVHRGASLDTWHGLLGANQRASAGSRSAERRPAEERSHPL